VTPDPEAARLCLLCAAAEALGPVAALNAPGPAQGWAAPPAWVTDSWALSGWLTAEDEVLGFDAGRKFYGWLLVRPTEAVIVVRGTGDAIEWLIDAEGWSTTEHPIGGQVETGFYSVYQTLQFRGTDGGIGTLLAAAGERSITVAGHSLGGAIATYLTADLCSRLQVRGRYFESPRPGDTTFAARFDALVDDYMTWHYEPDIVPDLPPTWMGYASLPRVTIMPANPSICDTPVCDHHAQNIAWILDNTSTHISSGCAYSNISRTPDA